MKDEQSDGIAASAGTTTTVGPTITIRGKLTSREDLIVKGRIDAEISSSKALLIENSGVVRANVNVESARISGILLGDLTAETKIEIASDGRMIGDMLAPRIVVHDGAAFRGKIDMPNFDNPQDRSGPSPTAAAGSDSGAAGEVAQSVVEGSGGAGEETAIGDAGAGHAAATTPAVYASGGDAGDTGGDTGGGASGDTGGGAVGDTGGTADAEADGEADDGAGGPDDGGSGGDARRGFRRKKKHR